MKMIKRIWSWVPKSLEEFKWTLILIGLYALIIGMIVGSIFLAYVKFRAYWAIGGL